MNNEHIDQSSVWGVQSCKCVCQDRDASPLKDDVCGKTEPASDERTAHFKVIVLLFLFSYNNSQGHIQGQNR